MHSIDFGFPNPFANFILKWLKFMLFCKDTMLTLQWWTFCYITCIYIIYVYTSYTFAIKYDYKFRFHFSNKIM